MANHSENAWKQGFWQEAIPVLSPNFAERPKDMAVDLIVLHNISLPPFCYGTGAVEDLFANQIQAADNPFFGQLTDLRVSSHFFIPRTGQVVQCVSADNMAYHAGVSSFQGREACNRFSIGIELEGCDFEPFDTAQYAALNRLIDALCLAYPISAITGHQDIAPARKTDPGHFFDWHALVRQDLLCRNRA